MVFYGKEISKGRTKLYWLLMPKSFLFSSASVFSHYLFIRKLILVKLGKLWMYKIFSFFKTLINLQQYFHLISRSRPTSDLAIN